MPTPLVHNIHSSVMKNTLDNVGKEFKQVLDQLEKAQNNGNQISAVDTLKLQQNMYRYSYYNETVTKITAKAATAINEVLKAQ